jgi:hypothetical protein
MSSIHNPKNFQPENYDIVEYMINRPPVFIPGFGMNPNDHLHCVQEWQREMVMVFGEDYRSKIYRCAHCGNGRIKYIVACRHIPSGEVVAFGDTCIKRLGFKDADEFKMNMIRSKANEERKAAKLAEKCNEFMVENPSFGQAIRCYEDHKDIHERNQFAADIVYKFRKYASASERQIAAFIKSVATDHVNAIRREEEAKEVKGPAPEGRVEVKGRILSIKHQDNQWGGCFKMLVKLENNSKVWLTAPDGVDTQDIIEFKATFERSRDDESFGFGKRPHLIRKSA